MEQPSKPAGIEDAEVVEPGVRDERAGDTGEDGTDGGRLSDMLRRAMVAGLGAVFMTEEGIRTYVKDMKLPKEVMNFVVGQAGRSKDELFRVVGEELRRFFESAALKDELKKLISEMTIEVKAEIRLRPEGEAPEVKVTETTTRRVPRKKA